MLALDGRNHRSEHPSGRRRVVRRRHRKRRRRHRGHGQLHARRLGHPRPALPSRHREPACAQLGLPHGAPRAGEDGARGPHARLRPRRDRSRRPQVRLRHHGGCGLRRGHHARRRSGQAPVRSHGLPIGGHREPHAAEIAFHPRPRWRAPGERRAWHLAREFLEDPVRHHGNARQRAARRRVQRGGAQGEKPPSS